jgi:uncharacterized protein
VPVNVKRLLLTSAGCTAVAIGAAGMVLPVLPTTPFIIIAALCFSASSPRMYYWLASSRYFGEFIVNYREGRGVSRKVKTFAIASLSALMAISIVIMHGNLPVVIILLIVWMCVATHIILIKGNKSDASSAQE